MYLRIDLDPASETCLHNVCMSLHQTQSTLPLSPLSLSLSLSESTPVWRPCWRSSMMLTEKNMRVFKQCGGLRQQAGPGQPLPCPNRTIHFIALSTSMNSALNICSVSFSESLTFFVPQVCRRIWTASNRDCSLSPQHTFNSHSPGRLLLQLYSLYSSSFSPRLFSRRIQFL